MVMIHLNFVRSPPTLTSFETYNTWAVLSFDGPFKNTKQVNKVKGGAFGTPGKS